LATFTFATFAMDKIDQLRKDFIISIKGHGLQGHALETSPPQLILGLGTCHLMHAHYYHNLAYLNL
jgi:hypothetical protein